jgi:siroheme synthase (precorrin-2 oxidase/ferrochelatase)
MLLRKKARITMKKKIIALTVSIGIVTGGTTFAAVNYLQELKNELKQQHEVEVIGFMNDFRDRMNKKRVEEEKAQTARIKKVTSEYLNQKLSEYEKQKVKEFEGQVKREADQVIQELKQHIDEKIAGY